MTTTASMAALDSMRDSIVSTISTAVGSIATVKAHRGRFDLDAIQRYATASPFIAIAYLGSSGSTDNGMSIVDLCNWGAFIVTQETIADKRDKKALALNALVKSIVHRNRFGNNGAQAPGQIRADNLVTKRLDEIGIDLHVVSWEQGVEIPPYDEPATLDDFNKLFTEYDLAESTDDDTEADDLIDLTG